VGSTGRGRGDMVLSLLFVVFLFLIAVEVPIGFALGLSSLSYLLLDGRTPLVIMVQKMTSGLDSFPFLALPLFVLAGNVFSRAGIARRIFDFARAVVGHVNGGLAHVNVLASMIFAGMSGTAQADAAGLGIIEIEEMNRDGFDPVFSAAITAASSIIGPIIPPSVIMVIFAMLTEVSVASLFLGGFLPGVLMGLSLMGMTYWLAATNRIHAPRHPRQSLRIVWRKFWGALPALVAPLFLIGGMLLGVATPTELGAIVVVYGIVLGFLYREITIRELWDIFAESAVVCGILVFIISVAFPFGWLVAINQIPALMAKGLLAVTANKWIILMMINVLLLIAGCFMETTAILVISVPVLFPLVTKLGVDPVHFGLVMIINLLIGTCTPPFGICLFITMQIAKVPLPALIRAVFPFLIPMILVLFLLTYVPQIVLFLPNLFK
jgi:TRAP-type transport system large permease protein